MDTEGDVGQFASIGALGDRWAVAYHDASAGALKLAIGPDGEGAWAIRQIDAGEGVGRYAHLEAGRGIAYLAAGLGDVRYARWPGSPAATSPWRSSTTWRSRPAPWRWPGRSGAAATCT